MNILQSAGERISLEGVVEDVEICVSGLPEVLGGGWVDTLQKEDLDPSSIERQLHENCPNEKGTYTTRPPRDRLENARSAR
jgi:hypothetical protein